jgi:hypothetical protein
VTLTKEMLRLLDVVLERLRCHVLSSLMFANDDAFDDVRNVESVDEAINEVLVNEALKPVIWAVAAALRSGEDIDQLVSYLNFQDECWFENDSGEVCSMFYSDLKEAWRRIPPGRTILNELPPEDVVIPKPIGYEPPDGGKVN